MTRKLLIGIAGILSLLTAGFGQQIREYIRLGGRVIAIETSGGGVLSVAPATRSAAAAGGSGEFAVSGVSSWSATVRTADQGWLTIATKGTTVCSSSGAGAQVNATEMGTLCFWATTASSSRIGEITFNAPNQSQVTVTVTQTVGFQPSVSPTSVNLTSPSAGSTYFDVTINPSSDTEQWVASSNSAWATVSVVAAQSSCTTSSTTTTASGFGSKRVCVFASANALGVRSATITITLNVGGASASFGVSQTAGAGNCSLSLDQSSIVQSSQAFTRTVAVSANRAWAAALVSGVGGAAGLSFSTSIDPSSNNGTLTVWAQDNGAASAREWVVRVSSSGCASVDIKVTQQSANLLSLPPNIQVGYNTAKEVFAVWTGNGQPDGSLLQWTIASESANAQCPTITRAIPVAGSPDLYPSTSTGNPIRLAPVNNQGAVGSICRLSVRYGSVEQTASVKIILGNYLILSEAGIYTDTNPELRVQQGEGGKLKAKYLLPEYIQLHENGQSGPAWPDLSTIVVAPENWGLSMSLSAPDVCLVQQFNTDNSMTLLPQGGTRPMPYRMNSGSTQGAFSPITGSTCDLAGPVLRTKTFTPPPAQPSVESSVLEEYGGLRLKPSVSMPAGTKVVWAGGRLTAADTVPYQRVATFDLASPNNAPPRIAPNTQLPLEWSGTTATLQAVAEDSNGSANIDMIQLRVTDAQDSDSNACIIRYKRQTAQFSLLSNSGSEQPLGSSGSNSQCNVSGPSVFMDGLAPATQIGIRATVSFNQAFSGGHQFVAKVTDIWRATGSSTTPLIVNFDPVVMSASTIPTAGQSTNTSLIYSDPDGAANLEDLYVLFNDNESTSGGCWIKHSLSEKKTYVRSDDDQRWVTNPPANGRCRVNSAASTNLTSVDQKLVLGVSFDWPVFNGTNGIWAWADDRTLAGNSPRARVSEFAITAPGGNVVPLRLPNTGMNSTGTALLGPTQEDGNFTLRRNGTPIARPRVTDIPPWLQVSWQPHGPSAMWVSPPADSNANSLPGTYRYEYTFSLTGFNPATARIVGRVLSDNEARICLNSSPCVPIVPTNSEDPFKVATPFDLSSGFVSGLNTLAVEVENGDLGGGAGSPSGLQLMIDTAYASQNSNAPSYTVTATPETPTTVPAGGSVRYLVAVNGEGLGSVVVGVLQGTPPGATVSFNPSSTIAIGSQATVTISSSSTTPVQSYTLRIGSDIGTGHFVNVPMTVTSATGSARSFKFTGAETASAALPSGTTAWRFETRLHNLEAIGDPGSAHVIRVAAATQWDWIASLSLSRPPDNPGVLNILLLAQEPVVDQPGFYTYQCMTSVAADQLSDVVIRGQRDASKKYSIQAWNSTTGAIGTTPGYCPVASGPVTAQSVWVGNGPSPYYVYAGQMAYLRWFNSTVDAASNTALPSGMGNVFNYEMEGDLASTGVTNAQPMTLRVGGTVANLAASNFSPTPGGSSGGGNTSGQSFRFDSQQLYTPLTALGPAWRFETRIHNVPNQAPDGSGRAVILNDANGGWAGVLRISREGTDLVAFFDVFNAVFPPGKEGYMCQVRIPGQGNDGEGDIVVRAQRDSSGQHSIQAWNALTQAPGTQPAFYFCPTWTGNPTGLLLGSGNYANYKFTGRMAYFRWSNAVDSGSSMPTGAGTVFNYELEGNLNSSGPSASPGTLTLFRNGQLDSPVASDFQPTPGGVGQTQNIPGVVGTGVNVNNGADTAYQLVGGTSYVVPRANQPSSWSDDTGTTEKWIAPNNNAGNSWSPANTYVYRLTFTLPAGTDPSTAAIAGNVWADDSVQIKLNDVVVANASGFQMPTALVIQNRPEFRIGTNVLSFEVNNLALNPPSVMTSPTGLKVNINNATVR